MKNYKLISVKHLCNHLVDKKRPFVHRFVVGCAVSAIGVVITTFFVDTPFHLVMDGVGYAIHGIGILPIVERLENWASDI